jgi:hypothetical protein
MSVGPIIGLFVCHQWGYTAMFVSGCFISFASLAYAYAVHLRKGFLVGKRILLKWNSLFEKSSIRPSMNVFITMIAYGGLLSFIALYGREIGIQNSSLYFLIFSIGIAWYSNFTRVIPESIKILGIMFNTFIRII